MKQQGVVWTAKHSRVAPDHRVVDVVLVREIDWVVARRNVRTLVEGCLVVVLSCLRMETLAETLRCCCLLVFLDVRGLKLAKVVVMLVPQRLMVGVGLTDCVVSVPLPVVANVLLWRNVCLVNLIHVFGHAVDRSDSLLHRPRLYHQVFPGLFPMYSLPLSDLLDFLLLLGCIGSARIVAFEAGLVGVRVCRLVGLDCNRI